jgi:hypothetical protein
MIAYYRCRKRAPASGGMERRKGLGKGKKALKWKKDVF